MTKSPVCLIVPNSDGEDGSYSEHLLYTIYMCHVQCIYICTPLAFNAPPRKYSNTCHVCPILCFQYIYIPMTCLPMRCSLCTEYNVVTLIKFQSFLQLLSFCCCRWRLLGECHVVYTSCRYESGFKFQEPAPCCERRLSSPYTYWTRVATPCSIFITVSIESLNEFRFMSIYDEEIV